MHILDLDEISTWHRAYSVFKPVLKTQIIAFCYALN